MTKKMSKPLTVNVSSRSLGLVLIDEREETVVENLIQIYDPLPKSVSRLYRTHKEETMVDSRIVENILSSREVNPSECEEIGTVSISFPRQLPRGTMIKLDFSLDLDGQLTLRTQDPTSRNETEMAIYAGRVLSISEEELARLNRS